MVRTFVTEAMRREIDDPRLAAIVVTDVEVPDDLAFADIKVRLLVGDDDERARKAAVTSLQRAAPRLRRALGPSLQLRRVPELRFSYDVGHDAARRVDEILREIENEPKAGD
jgi:ribosome-binding factor A